MITLGLLITKDKKLLNNLLIMKKKGKITYFSDI